MAKFKWYSFYQKWFFPVANFFMYMLNVSLMNLKNIRICQKVFNSSWFHHACTITDAPSQSIQNPAVKNYKQESHDGPVLLTWLPDKFHVKWPFSSSYKSPPYFLSSYGSIGLSIQEKKFKTDFQDSHHGGHIWFPLITILTSFDLQVTQRLPTKFHVYWHFGSGEEVQNRFSSWGPWQRSWISN